MFQQLQNKLVLITGASSGFGAETARLFAKESCRLILLARRQDRLKILSQELYKKYETESYLIQCDVTNETQVKQRLDELPHPFAVPDLIINNAGLALNNAKLWETSSNDWNQMIDTNIKGILTITKYFMPRLLQAQKGHIINVGSVSGHDIYPGGSVYCATKFAVRALTDTLRLELVDTPIRVSLISPGMAKTEFSQVRFKGNEEKAEQVYQGMEPLSALDVAEAILFIASRPDHVNIADLILYPKQQASTTLIHRKQ